MNHTIVKNSPAVSATTIPNPTNMAAENKVRTEQHDFFDCAGVADSLPLMTFAVGVRMFAMLTLVCSIVL